MTVDLIHADCVAATASLADSSIDLTVTSPPYDTLRDYTNEGDWTFAKFEQLAKELYRVTKEGGVVMWNVADQTAKGSESGSSFKQALFFMQQGFKLHDTMIYKKANSGGARGSNKAYTQAFEYMFVFAKGPLKTFNPIKDRPNKRVGEVSKAGGGRTKAGLIRATRQIITEAFGKRSNIWTYPTQQDAWSKKHPAAMPLQMAEDHIRSWTNEGDTIFDPFTGSGTSGLAAASLNRHFIGCDVSEEYLNIAAERLAAYDPVSRSLASTFTPAVHDEAFWSMSEDAARAKIGELSASDPFVAMVIDELASLLDQTSHEAKA